MFRADAASEQRGESNRGTDGAVEPRPVSAPAEGVPSLMGTSSSRETYASELHNLKHLPELLARKRPGDPLGQVPHLAAADRSRWPLLGSRRSPASLLDARSCFQRPARRLPRSLAAGWGEGGPSLEHLVSVKQKKTPEKKALEKIGSQSTKSGAGEQSLLLDCMAKAPMKGMFCS